VKDKSIPTFHDVSMIQTSDRAKIWQFQNRTAL